MTSAHASASDSSTVLRAGTYVAGIVRVVERPIPWDLAVPDQRRAAERGEIDGELDVLDDAKRRRDRARGLELTRVHLAVAHAQGEELVALRPGDRRRRVGIQTAAEEHNRPLVHLAFAFCL